MKKSSWAFTYLLRCLVLLGFFSANPSFAAISPECPPPPNKFNIVALCASYSPPATVVNERTYLKSNGMCEYLGDCSNGFMNGHGGEYGKPTPTPTPSPTPSPTPDPCAGAAGKTVGNSSSTLTYPIGTTFQTATNIGCLAGCKVLPSEIATGKNPLGQEIVFARGPFLNVGQKCDAEGSSSGGSTGTPAPTPPPLHDEPSGKTCEKPKCPGEINGQTVCVACDARKTTEEKKEEKTESDGTKTETTTKEETICTGSKCTTTSTTTTQPKDANGVPVGTPSTKTDKKEEDADSFCLKNPRHKQCSETNDFCKQNPDLQVCKSGSYSDTSCGSSPSCTGDAVQCAQAANAFKAYCETKKTADAVNGSGDVSETFGNLNAAFQFAASTDSLLPGKGDLNIGSLDQSNPWNSTCLADKEVAEFEGHKITIPFSKYCSIFELMGSISVAVTLLVAALYIFRD